MSDDATGTGKLALFARCPICGKPPAAAVSPFCSKRCADVDLNRWLGGTYAIPAAEEPDPDLEGEVGER
jgi:hypothetical protein